MIGNQSSTFYFIVILLIISSCQEASNNAAHNEPTLTDLQPLPVQKKLDTLYGYQTDPVFGKPVEYLINEQGDTLITGSPIKIPKKVILLDTVPQPTETLFGPADSVVKFTSNMQSIGPVKTTVLNEVKVKTIPLPKNQPDSIQSPVKKIVSIPRQPEPIPSHPLMFKENFTKSIQFLNLKQGLGSANVMTILLDKKNRLWIGSVNGGLAYYDGTSLWYYGIEQGLDIVSVTSLVEDQNGNIWIGTMANGLFMFDGYAFTKIMSEKDNWDKYVWDVYEDHTGNIWCATHTNGVFKYDGKNITNYTINEGLCHNTITDIYEDSKHNLWFGSSGGGVSKFNGVEFTNYAKESGLGSDVVFSMVEDQEGQIWFGTWGNGIISFDGTTFTCYDSKSGLVDNNIHTICKDRKGNLWIGTHGSGINRFDGHSISNYTEKEGLSNDVVFKIIEGNDGCVWAGTWGGGINRINPHSFSHFDKKSGMIEGINAIAQDSKQNLWLSLHLSGLCYFDNQSFKYYFNPGGISQNSILSMLKDNAGNMWFGSQNKGLYRYDGKLLTKYGTAQGIPEESIRFILKDNQENIWLAASNTGLIQYSPVLNILTIYSKDISPNLTDIRTICEAKNGNIWIGARRGGISCFNGSHFINYTTKEGLSHNDVSSIAQDDFGNIWIGTRGGGLNRFDGRNFTYYTTKEGLSSNIITSITVTPEKELLVRTNSGLSLINVYDTLTTNSHYNIINFGIQEGIRDVSIFNGAEFQDHTGRIWLRTNTVLSSIAPGKKLFSTQKPILQLNKVEIKGQHIDFNYNHNKDSIISDIQFDTLSKFPSLPIGLEIPFSQNHLTFYFSAVDWFGPHKVKYTYKLEGLDEKWSTLNNIGKADYRNIPYGDYTFKVKAVGKNKLWANTIEYNFSVTAPWWYTWWARIGYIIVLSVLIYLFYKWIDYRSKERQNKLETRIILATKEIQDQKEELKQTLLSNEEKQLLLREIHHRVKNNFQIINSLIRLQANYTNQTNYRERLIETETRIRSMSLIHEMLYQTESLIDLDPKDYINELRKNIMNSYTNMITTNIEFNISINSGKISIDNLIVLGIIINEVFSNSIKYGFADKDNGELGLELSDEKNCTILKIWDDGVGSDLAIDTLKHNSLGMDLIWSLTEQIDGKVELDSKNGFLYHFKFPLLK